MHTYFSFMERWAPSLGRIILGLIFIVGSLYKIPTTEMFQFQVEGAAAVGLPFPVIAVFLGFLLELLGGIALVIGWKVREVASLLIGFVILIALFYGRDLGDQTQMMVFFSCLQLISGLLFIVGYGKRR